MEHMQTSPRVSEEDFIGLVAKVEHFSNPYIDGKVLSSLMKTAYYCCLKKAALLALNIRDIVDRTGSIRDTILGYIPIGDDIGGVFVQHLEYLRTGGYPRHRSNPVFPNKRKERYGPRQLQYDLKRCTSGLDSDIRLESIRQSGICRYYERMREEGHNARECMQQTIRFSHCSARHVEGILKDRIVPAGRRKNPFMEHYRIIEAIELGSIKPTNEYITVFKDDIENDLKLNAELRSLLLSELDRVLNIRRS